MQATSFTRSRQARTLTTWKPIVAVGKGVQEIRIWDAAGTFRVIYIATLPKALYVLHCFTKRTQQTLKADLDLATARFKALLMELKR